MYCVFISCQFIITSSQNTKRIYFQTSEQLFPKRWLLHTKTVASSTVIITILSLLSNRHVCALIGHVGPVVNVARLIFKMAATYNYTCSWKALGRDCTNNNGLILKIGVLSFYVLTGSLYHTVFAGFRCLSVYIKAYINT